MNEKKPEFKMTWRHAGLSLGEGILFMMERRYFFVRRDTGVVYELIKEGAE